MTTLRARFDGKVLVPLDPVDFIAGDVIELRVVQGKAYPIGSPALLRKMMHEPPRLAGQDVDELERTIEEGKNLAHPGGVFDDLDT
jgi:hypothetical protein